MPSFPCRDPVLVKLPPGTSPARPASPTPEVASRQARRPPHPARHLGLSCQHVHGGRESPTTLQRPHPAGSAGQACLEEAASNWGRAPRGQGFCLTSCGFWGPSSCLPACLGLATQDTGPVAFSVSNYWQNETF